MFSASIPIMSIHLAATFTVVQPDFIDPVRLSLWASDLGAIIRALCPALTAGSVLGNVTSKCIALALQVAELMRNVFV